MVISFVGGIMRCVDTRIHGVGGDHRAYRV